MTCFALLTLLAVALVACAPRQSAQRAAAIPEATIEQIYIATERALDRTGPSFGEPRNAGIRYFRAAISIPPTHRVGNIEWHEGPPDPATDFVVTETEVYEGNPGFVNAVKKGQTAREVLVFVHGYNNTLSEAMYRLAQIQHDFNSGLPSVLFSWPSAGDPRGYVYDRDSVLYARDDLELLLKSLTRGPQDKVTLVAHSMGSHLVMETMRQAALKGDRRLLSRISSVILMSPDIDPDVFRRQAEAIGRLPQPFLMFISREDRALGLAGFITGRKPRLGVIDSPEAVAGLDVKVIDFTALGDGEGLNHAVPTSSPTAISVLKGMIAQAQSGERAFQNYMVLTAQP
ncbi:alpha/beta fold hydrolase [Roseovarius faecimaris]|uniref:Alpha/beta fold hydrolase n=2 Tax=Roseovarius faecimaris TaxID=2494550 RepID=A0A6I6IUJ7_9RHOB|nr:alpha/beta fold hydrolase [Roseovarius faecimaris]